jgi:hypothetical protein
MTEPERSSPYHPGPIILFGSGETSPSGRQVFDQVLRGLHRPPGIALIETPAGFELNTAHVIGRVAEFIEHRLQNYRPQVFTIPARQRGTECSPDIPQISDPMLDADLLFMGPGSPSYAVRQLRDSLTWQRMLALHYLGVGMVLASAATVAVSAFALPVYEIYKVGEDLHWKDGLDLFGLYGLPLVFIPHWNNKEGGEELDTSRCFMGQKRFARLMELLPAGLTVMGIDEKTALVMDLAQGTCRVAGLGGVTLIHTGHEHEEASDADLAGTGLREVAEQRESHVHIYYSGETFLLSVCCPMVPPEPGMGIPTDVWQQTLERRQLLRQSREAKPVARATPDDVLDLAKARQVARLRKDWAAADRLREQILALGWQVKDSPDGPQLEPTPVD